MTLFTIGTDPEFPLYHLIKNKFVSAIPYIKGTKKDPIQIGGYEIHHDNVALEISTPPYTKPTLMYNGMNIIKDRIHRDFLTRNHLVITHDASVIFDNEELDHEDAQVFGCDGDWNAWTHKENEIPKKLKNGNLRSFGGHVHIGATDDSLWLQDKAVAPEFVKFLDTTLGFMSVILDNTEASLQRKRLYGKAGCYRTPDHGIEYRTLSNFWLKNRSLMYLVYSIVKDSVIYFSEYDTSDLINHIGHQNIRETIEKGHIDFAEGWFGAYFESKVLSSKTRKLLSACEEINKFNNVQVAV